MPADKVLSIVVPYRDRAEHLDSFIPHIMRYFKHDKLDRDIPFSVTVVQQQDGGSFNAAMLRNAGFDLTREADYHVFHDVDYLPIWADYSYCETPARLIWFGAERRPVAPGSNIAVEHEYRKFKGGVILVPRDIFLEVNGYSNEFWGWGWQDTDMANRCIAKGHQFEKRDGFYRALDHISRAQDSTGTPRPQALKNIEKGQANAHAMVEGKGFDHDGLSNLKYNVLKTTKWNVADEARAPNFLFGQTVLVHLPGQEDTPEEDVVIEARKRAELANA